MLIILDKKVTKEQLKKASEDLDAYIKFVIDIEREILTIGGKRHFEGEKLLLENGSKQENLWGGGIDLESDSLDFDAIINIRPRQDNPSKEILSKNIREKVKQILVNKKLWKD
jgi:hypothetical protein